MTQHENAYDEGAHSAHWSHRTRVPSAGGIPLWLVFGLVMAWPVSPLRVIMPFALLFWVLERLLGRPPLAGAFRLRTKDAIDRRFMSCWLIVPLLFAVPAMSSADFFLIDGSIGDRQARQPGLEHAIPDLASIPDADWIARQNPQVDAFRGTLGEFVDRHTPEGWQVRMEDHHKDIAVVVPQGLRFNDAVQLIAAEHDLIVERDYTRQVITVLDADTPGTGRLAIRGFQLPSTRPPAADPATDINDVWALSAGAWLSDELAAWADLEGLSLDWALEGYSDWRVSHNVQFQGTFIDALEALHQVYVDNGDMHDVEFYVSRGNGVLVVREIDPALVGR